MRRKEKERTFQNQILTELVFAGLDDCPGYSVSLKSSSESVSLLVD